MAKAKQPPVPDAEDIANVLRFLANQQPLEGVVFKREYHISLECGRMTVLDWLASCVEYNASDAKVRRGTQFGE